MLKCCVKEILAHVRSAVFVETDDGWNKELWFVTGVGYDTISKDLLDGETDGEKSKEFFINEN